MIKVVYDRAASQVTGRDGDRHAWHRDPSHVRGRRSRPADTFGARTLADGTVTVYKNGALIGTTNVTAGPSPWPATLATRTAGSVCCSLGTTDHRRRRCPHRQLRRRDAAMTARNSTATSTTTQRQRQGRHHHECTQRAGRHRSTAALQVCRRRGGRGRRRRIGDELAQPLLVVGVGRRRHMATIQPDRYMFLGGTDGWIGLPPTPAIPPFHPDPLGGRQGVDLTTYIFGFRNITGLTTPQRFAQKNKAQHCAPLFWVNQYDPDDPTPSSWSTSPTSGSRCGPTCSTLTPCTGTGSATSSRSSTASRPARWRCRRARCSRYVYRPRDPGTYMYHCHVEDVEHVHMGMNGLVFVRPLQDGNTTSTRAASTSTTTVTARPGSTASSRCSCRRCGPSRTGPTPTSSCRSGATTTPTSACSTDGSTPTRRSERPVHDGCDRPHVSTRCRGRPYSRRPDSLRPARPEHLQYQPLPRW